MKHIAAAAAIVAAGYLAATHAPGWGWFLAVGVVLGGWAVQAK